MPNLNPPNLNSIDTQLLQIATTGPPRTIADVMAVMERIDALLPGSDGLKWFNKLYWLVTQQIDGQLPGNAWKDAAWLTHLDVVFAERYFQTIAEALRQDPNTASSWEVLFEARNKTGIDRIQFALAGMNAHINHDLALALIQTDSDLKMQPLRDSPEHDDYQRVNDLLEQVLPAALNFLAVGIAGELAQDAGKVGRLLAIWNVRAARDLAWDFAGHLQQLRDGARDFALETQDKLTGVIGRGLLVAM